MNAVNNSFGSVIGSAIGKTAAYAVHGAVRAGQSTGRFGQDVVAGTSVGYATKSVDLKARRALLTAARQLPVAMTVADPVTTQRRVKAVTV